MFKVNTVNTYCKCRTRTPRCWLHSNHPRRIDLARTLLNPLLKVQKTHGGSNALLVLLFVVVLFLILLIHLCSCVGVLLVAWLVGCLVGSRCYGCYCFYLVLTLWTTFEPRSIRGMFLSLLFFFLRKKKCFLCFYIQNKPDKI